jgi:hypothetical protein
LLAVVEIWIRLMDSKASAMLHKPIKVDGAKIARGDLLRKRWQAVNIFLRGPCAAADRFRESNEDHRDARFSQAI